eukprot:TRINITY_DN15893_c0_g1_i2.p1 TRINITY_DN15893_c0_g1~~TRINITY_DN15893_c0_g1_i2.p1  ORF type:complete len:119 (-),score=26.48 TRINITY_DN15893_c0_g1_i2:51-407(-)
MTKSAPKVSKGPLTMEHTINLHKHTSGMQNKKKAPRAIQAIVAFAQKAMQTKDVRLDVKVNGYVWSRGIKNPPFRIRVRLARKRNEDEDAKEKLYTAVSLVAVPAFKGLLPQKVKETL